MPVVVGDSVGRAGGVKRGSNRVMSAVDPVLPHERLRISGQTPIGENMEFEEVISLV
jgi:hypothetical protein